jgi:hypothetical protein
MDSSGRIKPVYDPDTLGVMAEAFDRACRFLPNHFRHNDRMRRRLASQIIRHINEGETDPTRLADSAILSIRQYFSDAGHERPLVGRRVYRSHP